MTILSIIEIIIVVQKRVEFKDKKQNTLSGIDLQYEIMTNYFDYCNFKVY